MIGTKLKKFGTMSSEKRIRRNDLLKKTIVTLVILTAYYIFVRLTGFSIPCLFREITGLKCPGCGISRMCMHLAQLEFGEAFLCNPLMFLLLPVFAVLLAVKLIFMPDCLEVRSRGYRIGERVCLVTVLAYWVVRNIIGI